MNRAEFLNEVAKCKKVSHGNAYRSVKLRILTAVRTFLRKAKFATVMDTIRLALMRGESIEIGGFGTFTVVTDLKGERIPVFKGGRAMKKVLNSTESKEGERYE